eukprot:Gregarina_sp_Pseudo_9__5905@NODE_935_length_2053_cov_34_058093_g877_i0_p2_GENE_NODE_935_length_2053_cov_34_058093_g877_i0NODE_935_length_2053_cov_34_058093_g877_i0_p2_ORF_typecomplete_len204_score10_11DUF1529/PF07485_11/0_16_NODE_935_length_2053_cov_34_058093_g877_i04911102
MFTPTNVLTILSCLGGSSGKIILQGKPTYWQEDVTTLMRVLDTSGLELVNATWVFDEPAIRFVGDGDIHATVIATELYAYEGPSKLVFIDVVATAVDGSIQHVKAGMDLRLPEAETTSTWAFQTRIPLPSTLSDAPDKVTPPRRTVGTKIAPATSIITTTTTATTTTAAGTATEPFSSIVSPYLTGEGEHSILLYRHLRWDMQ